MNALRSVIILVVVMCSYSTVWSQTTYVTKYYNVTGSTAKELLEKITTKSPIKSSGLTIIQPINVGYEMVGRKCINSNKFCKVKVRSVTVKDKIIQVYPKWINKKSAKKCLQQRWAKMMQNLRKHEDNHKKIYASYGGLLKKRLLAIPYMPNVKTLKKRIQFENKRLIGKLKAENKRYDKKTNKGQKEGVTLGPC